MKKHKSELVKVNWYGNIYANDEAESNFYIVCFISVPYTIQEDVESYGNQLASGHLVCNKIYTSPGIHK